MRSKLLALFVLLLPTCTAYAQDNKTESTEAVTNAAKAGAAQVNEVNAVSAKAAEKQVTAEAVEVPPDAAKESTDDAGTESDSASELQSDSKQSPPKQTASKSVASEGSTKQVAKVMDTKQAKKKLVEEQKPTRLAFTTPPEDNIEYELMGEFYGDVEMEDGATKTIGLQIRPLGNGEFEALQYAGGLPGQDGFSNDSPFRLVGRLSGDFVVLSGGPWAYFAEPTGCLIVDRKGRTLGNLVRVVRESPTLGVLPPAEAVVLFDGSGVEKFTSARMTEEGLLMEGADTLPLFQDFNMHVEFRLPYMPTSNGQQRGNSGCYLQSRYELQVLDSFGELPVFNGCSAIYRQKPADLNMCLPPLQWQTYDIQFTAPRWGADGSKMRNAHITVWHNGVKTQDNYSIINKTGAGKEEAPTLLPIRFQNHSDPVRYRNIWVVDRGLILPEFPLYSQSDDKSTEVADLGETDVEVQEEAESKEPQAEAASTSEADGDSE